MTAAFIGPGTVTTCTLAGERFGYALLWALTFATLGTIVLQEMSARLGVVGGIGLGEAIRRRFTRPGRGVARIIAVALVAGAIGVGNAAYQAGNLMGASLGAQAVAGGDTRVWALALAVTASALLWIGSYRLLERVLVGMVMLMSLVFLLTAIAVARDGSAILSAALIPRMPDGAALETLALVGTTIVPYNLFLHASSARQRWSGAEGLRDARADLVIAIALGGLVSMAILITAASSPGQAVATATDMAAKLEPLLGRWATVFFAAGFFAAGLTSAITAPMAAAYAMSGAFGWLPDLRAPLLRFVWLAVMATGLFFAVREVRPLPAILFAQAANGLLLPMVAVFLLIVMNDRRTVGRAANGWVANILGGAVVLLTVVLGLWRLGGLG